MTEAIARQESVQLTRHGELVAEIEPRPRGISGAEFVRRWRNRRRLGKEVSDEMLAALKKLDKAR